jgi:Flp pilus assembly protein TadG
MSGRRPDRAGDRGAATAELALTLPLLVAVTIGLVWLLSVGVAQVRVVDAARETARAAARGEGTDEAVARGLQVAPPGSRITVRSASGDGRVTADAVGQVTGPGGLFGFLPVVTVRAEAVAAAEQTP